MTVSLSKPMLARMFAEAAKLVREHCEELSRLDSIGGDGDHGTTMVRAMAVLEGDIEPANGASLSEMLARAGWSVMGVDGGASSALLGTFIAGMGDIELGEELDCERLAASFEAGLRAVSNRTKARPGDKTMMDALAPAVEAVRVAASSRRPIAAALKEAADAAAAGAESTKHQVARHGRAKYLGEKTLGHADAGATSIALIFRGFATAVAEP
jgi:phosphoenolpyruvate---glycerone phosphotransferase subunit DhaL